MGFLKDVVTAFKPSNIARGLDAARNPPSQAEIDAQVAQLPPEQRAAYDANMARVRQGQAEAEQSWHEAHALEESLRVLGGPAGRYLYGASMEEFGTPDEIQARIAEQGVWSVVGDMRAKRKGEFKTALRQTFNIQEVDQIEDPEERRRIAAEERAARDRARAPYLAPERVPVTITRIATRGATQVAELIAHLSESGLAARPDHVFGVYRVPDRISGALTPHSESGRVVEWDAVHTPLPDGAERERVPCQATSFVGDDQWVARSVGQPSVLDEDVALELCRRARIGPERCLGLARVSEFRHLKWGGEDTDLLTLVRGIVAIHPDDASASFAQMQAAAPLDLPDPAASGIHVEVLNWREIGRATHLKIHHPPPVPSPFPYLPATPQELLRAHLDIVGLRPSDCYSAQATVDTPSPLVQGGVLTSNIGPKQPCADGKDRMRTRGCQQVIVAYRDRPEYAEGRSRWAAYQEEVLQAHLERGMRLRPPLTVPDDDLSGVPTAPLRAAVRAAQVFDRIDVIGQEKITPFRYCWPPVVRAA